MQFRVYLLRDDGTETQLDCQTFKGFAYKRACEFQLAQLSDPQERKIASKAVRGSTNEEKFLNLKNHVDGLNRCDIPKILVRPFQKPKSLEELRKDNNAGSNWFPDSLHSQGSSGGPYPFSSTRSTRSGISGLSSSSSLDLNRVVSERDILERMRSRPRRFHMMSSDSEPPSASGQDVVGSESLESFSSLHLSEDSSSSSRVLVLSYTRREPYIVPLTYHLVSKAPLRYYRRTW